MHEQARLDPLEPSEFFADGQSARPLVPGTVARGHLKTDTHLHSGTENGKFVETFPSPVTRETLERGRERYDIFCAPCHDRLGYGSGRVVERGFPKPKSFHTEELRAKPPGHFFDAITRGYGTMFGMADMLSAEDRWAVVAYLRALQFSQHAGPEIEAKPEETR